MSDQQDLITLTADIVSAHVSNNSVSVDDVATLVQKVHAALTELGADTTVEPVAEKKDPVVSIRASVKPNSITCLICAKKHKTLKRHIASAHDMTPAQYRETFGLKSDYPMVAPEYSARRSEMAHALGLGRKDAPKPVKKRQRKVEGVFKAPKSTETT